MNRGRSNVDINAAVLFHFMLTVQTLPFGRLLAKCNQRRFLKLSPVWHQFCLVFPSASKCSVFFFCHCLKWDTTMYIFSRIFNYFFCLEHALQGVFVEIFDDTSLRSVFSGTTSYSDSRCRSVTRFMMKHLTGCAQQMELRRSDESASARG